MTTLHPDFSGLTVDSGRSDVRSRPDLFSIINLIEFGGDADRPTHVPSEIAQVGPVVVWESTGAADALPFWNTNQRSDMYLYIVHGGVRVELKETGGAEIYGEYVARTGDLSFFPKDVAHRTYSLDGKRRITIEILERDPAWSTIGSLADVTPARRPEVGGFTFAIGDQRATIAAGGSVVETPSDFFRRGLRALVAWELHLGHNEFEGGFVVHDLGDDRARLSVPGHEATLPVADVLAVFKALLQ